ncbi:hypothetical protein LTR91_014697 [Friedmanniomyces endolithicus]|uniref:Transport and Golgi organization protein 2 n=1 Tax=Friedmanniomyces endolithicus TaxID=329885 RepID=A0AAN6KBB1_9PEZI|nr:hypothetical protein LTR94_021147 [Friedmanniomyces endolithicus]KAK0778758.1 hypothetical protein LTR75_015563 [Friedmanniomyces endolithicus]KAK0784347.1 hypothetical protein LTR59_011469 [Friedmanniomyces endolithicus]KAK0784525.1 hypothetical protein LTR38_012662 [Friedmanniomyces endolithicus]KAK0874827.1 hypothetical protein LTR87_011381 [Friedmanniomyces endolithicus]
MCISLLSTAHPTYPFILLNNRDEFLSRPTARAHWWDPPNQHVLGGRDLQREIRGTWLAITKDGRIANLTNFRDGDGEVASNVSRGGLVSAYFAKAALESDGEESYDGFVRRLVGEVDVKKVGGFTLLFGRLRKPDGEGRVPGLGVLSNRTSSAEGVFRICGELGETQGLSNSHFGDREWPKVVQGEKLLSEAISGSISRGEDQEGLVERLFGVLSVDTLPRPKPGEDFQAFTKQLRNSILIPPVGGEAAQSKPADKIAAADGTGTPDHSGVKVGDGVYGTQKQTVVLVDMRGRVNFIERTLHDGDGGLDSDDNKDRRYEFTIEEWER